VLTPKFTVVNGTSLWFSKPEAVGQIEARSSVEEHYLDTVGVSGSIPLVPTKTICRFSASFHTMFLQTSIDKS
jgi:hypothetical protein